MEHDLLESLRRAHAEARMTGWDFSALEGRLIADDPWWDFEADCLDAMRYARAIADLGTGGGERLIRLVDALPDDRGGNRTLRWRGETWGREASRCCLMTRKPGRPCPSGTESWTW